MSEQRVKLNNRKVVLDVLRECRDYTIGEISALTRISKPTVKSVIDFYQASGLVEEAGKGSSTDEGGKRPTLFRFKKEYGYVISLHVGPDFIYTALSDMNADILFSRQFSIRRFGIHKVLSLLADATREYMEIPWTRGKQLINVVIGLPGIVDSEKGLLVYTPHYPDWGRNLPFASMYRELTNVICPLHIDCVNRFQAFAEYAKGVAMDTGNFITVDAMDVGLGAGVMVDGRLKHGISNLSGEIGHMVLQADGPLCNCGGRGCFEALVYVERVVEMLKQGFSGHESSTVYEHGDQSVTIDDLFSAAKEDDQFALEILDHIATWFAIGLNNIIMVNDPQKIVIQGVYARAGNVS